MLMKEQKLKVSDETLGSLINDIHKGDIRIPRFQREYVWKMKDTLKLFDSMYEEYPIGTIFLWDMPSQYNHMLREIADLSQPPIEKHKQYKVILDGQQRLTSLYAVVNTLKIGSTDFGRVVVDLDTETETYFKDRQPDDLRFVSVKNLLSQMPFSIIKNLNEEQQFKFESIRDVLLKYPIPVVTVNADNIRDAVKIFERINQRGKRLTRYDLICASVWSDDFNLRERVSHDIVSKFSSVFGKIPEARIPQALALITRDSAEERHQFALEVEQVISVWDKTVKGFQLAIDLVRENLGVARSDFLPYDAFLPVLTKYFSEIGLQGISSHEQRRQLEYWYWRSTFSQRYSSATDTRMTEDAQWLRQLIIENTPFRQLQVDNLDLPDTYMSRTSAIARGILCILNLQQPRHFTSKAKVNLNTDHFSKFTSAERHHIFPAAFLSKGGYKWYQTRSLANFCFIPADLNKKISNRAPSDYMTEIRDGYESQDEFKRVMSTHLIPVGEDSGIWTDDYELFLQQRARLLLYEIKRRCGIGSRINTEDQDSVVNRLEVALRNKIHETLHVQTSEYWSQHIPTHTHDNLHRKIEQEARKAPGNSANRLDSPRIKLDYCDVTDYADIILSKSNWDLFQGDFGSKGECNRNFGDLREYRNALKHNRDMSNIVSLRGEAAIEWLSHPLNVDLSEYGIKSPE
ncbi:MAG: DUF262 domain-containing protein [Chloroflexi bacterium]|nr:DUF262 domain-containing protein [Chloroflexota bacterium]